MLRVRFQLLLTLILYVAFGIAFVIHASGTATSYFSYPTSTQISLTREAVKDPSITLCSEMPFSLDKMVQMGFDNSNKSCRRGRSYEDIDVFVMVCEVDKMMWPLINQLEGFPNNLSVLSVWESSKLPQQLLIRPESLASSQIKWHPIITNHNTCYKYTSEVLHDSPAIVKFGVTDPYENFNCSLFYQEINCNWLGYLGPLELMNMQVTDHVETPLLISENNDNLFQVRPNRICKQYFSCLRELVVTYTIRRSIDTPASPCSSSVTYSQRNCVEKCIVTKLSHQHDCAPPFIPLEDLQQCTIGELRNGSLAFESSEMATVKGECEQSCPRQCERTFLRVRPFYAEIGTQVSESLPCFIQPTELCNITLNYCTSLTT